MYQMLLDELVSDIICNIYNELDFTDQVNLKLVSNVFSTYPITNLFTNSDNLTDDILKSYPHVIKLKISNDNRNVTDINHLLCLQKLYTGNNTNITNEKIISLTNLTELHIINYNHLNSNKITNINHLTNLRKLCLYGSDKINNNDIKSLIQLTALDINFTDKITDVNHLTNLRKLIATRCNIDNNAIKSLTNLIELKSAPCG
jgi:hypothetical protein